MKYLIIAVLVIIVIALIRYISKTNRMLKEQQREANRKHKEESLLKALANPMSDEIFDEEVNYRPYKVTYTEKNVNTESNNVPM